MVAMLLDIFQRLVTPHRPILSLIKKKTVPVTQSSCFSVLTRVTSSQEICKRNVEGNGRGNVT